ncbi:Dyp-type peroxidase [Corynebacterium renale]|uniref:Dye decolorizing peroxidase n=1 Tax=Corynebacterium renale TaxID=1724 RepID=A0A2A9DRQ2_9CORY|nr:Dyp-type peroxidase [Corynebacterium renale]PFG28600.1 dye decolorizing peroxidase [Corynebacterium renale]SQI26164.1 predicted iron-dependent peroxidase [Corynebacterium renale]
MKSSGIGRRHFLAGGVAGAVGLAATGCSQASEDNRTGDQQTSLGALTIPFDGLHQGGISTPEQAHLNLVGMNLLEGVDKNGLRRLLTLWTEDARALCEGRAPLGSLEPELARDPAELTITGGIGAPGLQRVGLDHATPEWLADIEPFERDALRPEWGQTDLVLQICGNDPLSVAYATRHMLRSSVSYAKHVWTQKGFMNAAGVKTAGETPRNLFGQKDGTINPRGQEELDQHVWATKDSSPAWMVDGTAMVVRRIQMHMDEWEKLDRSSREIVVGRTLDTGAPLHGGDEFDEIDMTVTDEYGLPAIDPSSHAARAKAPAENPEQQILRRPYNFDLPPVDVMEDTSNTGQIFICFQKDPRTQFTPIQRRLDQVDRLNEWITHIGSGVYAVFPGVGADGDKYWGEGLFTV